jgi:hypothetical protein
MTANRSTKLLFIAGMGLLQPLLPGSAQTPATPAIDGGPLVTIKELMEKTITPATNTLWNVPEAPTDAEWAALEEAAVTLLVAANVVALGGNGPMDNVSVKDPAWTAFNRAMIVAGRDALMGIRTRDPAALSRAGDILYPPCEGCHAQFNPAVVKAPE